MSWWAAFALTQAIEVPIYVLGTRNAALPLPWRIAVGFGASALTHPVVWFVLRALEAPLGFAAYFAVAETFAVLAEALYLRAFALPRPLWLAAIANGTSAGAGLLWWWLTLR